MPRLVYHADRISEHRARTPQGYLLALGVPIARTGWQNYKASEVGLDDLPPDTIVNVYRDESEVFNPATIASFEGNTITSPHPPEFLTSDNDVNYNRGHAQNVREGGILPDGNRSLIADLLIKDSRLSSYVDNGTLEEISCGYGYTLRPMSDGKYAMEEIRGNHVAIVPSGRAGSHVRVLDAQPEEGENVAEEKPSVFKELGEFLKTSGLRLVGMDANSETVETQEQKAKEAKELRMRTLDAAEEEKKEKEDKEAKDKKVKDEKDEKERKEASDARDRRFDRLMDAFEKSLEEKKERKEGEDDECTCGAEEGEPHKKDCPMYKGAEDADLIPVATLSSEDRPKNPIPGAIKAVDALLKIKQRVADSGTKEEKLAWNEAYRALKPSTAGDGSYAEITRARDTAREVNDQKEKANREPAKVCADFEDMARQYRGKNPKEVKLEAAK